MKRFFGLLIFSMNKMLVLSRHGRRYSNALAGVFAKQKLLSILLAGMLIGLTGCDNGTIGGDGEPIDLDNLPTITGIDVAGVKTEFYVGEPFSLGTVAVTVSYSEGLPDIFTGFTREQLEEAGITVDDSAFVSDVPSAAPIPIVVTYQGFGEPFTYYVTVVAPVPVITITANPEAITNVFQGEIDGSLVVEATVTEAGTPTYQWYSNNSASSEGGTAIATDGDESVFDIPTDLTAEGSPYYYFCEVSADGAEPVRSTVAVVTVEGIIAEEFYVDPIYYKRISGTNVKVTNKLYDDEVQLDDVINSYVGDVVIPSTVSYQGITYDVIAIGSRAFYGGQRLDSVTLPDTIKTIEDDYAFAECTSRSFSITLNEGLETIGANAFYNCHYLTTLNIPSTVTSICADAPVFRGCYSLSITAAEGGVFSTDESGALLQSGDGENAGNAKYYLRWIPEKFYGSYIIPDGVTEICCYSVDYVDALLDLTFPASVTIMRTIENFRGSGKLSAFRFKGAIPPETPDGIGELSIYPRMGTLVYVPKGSGGDYWAGIWENFRIIEYE